MTSEIRKYMLAVARQHCPAADAEDVVQDAMLVAQKHPADASSTTWLHTVVRTVATSHLRKLARRAAAIFPVETSYPSAEEVWLPLEEASSLKKAILMLSPPLQKAINLRLEHGRGAAQASGLSSNTYRSRVVVLNKN